MKGHKRHQRADTYYTRKNNFEKHRIHEWNREHKAGGFRCSHCKQFVVITDTMGTANRNHCNLCFWSKHVDTHKGDRRADCLGGMEPIGLTFKHEGFGRIGEVMIIHQCAQCMKLSINRIARDDPEDKLFLLFIRSQSLTYGQRADLARQGIYLLSRQDEVELHMQLYGT